MNNKVMRIAALQLKLFNNSVANVQNAAKRIKEAVQNHQPRLVVLPECFNQPFEKYLEKIPNGYTSQQLSKLAKEHGIYIVGGSFGESAENNAKYNTCTVWDPEGKLIAKYRKTHLFDVQFKNGVKYMESNLVEPGNEYAMFNVDGHKIGLGLCHDVRFEEMARVYSEAGCKMIIYPGIFSMTTGPLQWDLVHRARAHDNQVFVVAVSQARNLKAKNVVYAHSMIIDPWARVIERAGVEEETLIADIDFSLIEEAREQYPISKQRRFDLYKTENKGVFNKI